jgi:hypothetical protein
MAELLPEKLGQSENTKTKAGEGEGRKMSKRALQWVECFHIAL